MTIGAIKAVSIEPNGAFANVTLDSVGAQSVFANGFDGPYGNDPVAGTPPVPEDLFL